MIDRNHALPITRQAKALGVSRSSVYYIPRPVPAEDLKLMRRLDELHLDHPYGDWAQSVGARPAAAMGLQGAGMIRPGAPADLILFRARHMTEWLSRPQADRIVLRNGKVLDAEVPDWRELDHLFPATTG